MCGGDLHHRLKRRKMKKSWLHATLEEPLKKAASAAFLPIMITDSLENLHLKSLVVNKMKTRVKCFWKFSLLTFLFFFSLEFLFQAIVQVESAETDQERHKTGTKTGRSRRQSVSILKTIFLQKKKITNRKKSFATR